MAYPGWTARLVGDEENTIRRMAGDLSNLHLDRYLLVEIILECSIVEIMRNEVY
jgi:hypothetical protein